MEKLVAVKKQDRQNDVPDKHTLQELSILNHLRKSTNQSIIKYYGAHDEVSENGGTGGTNSLYIIMEFCQGGELLQLIEQEHTPLGWKFIIDLARQAVSAVKYLHEKLILHRDIKSSVNNTYCTSYLHIHITMCFL